jgi:hypothetical protein
MIQNSRKNLVRHSILVLSLASFAAACSAETSDGEQVPGPVGEVMDPGSSADSLVLPDGLAPEGAGPVDSAEPLESSESGNDKAGYVYIQYCDYPNSWVGTRCIWSNGNDFCGAVRECVGDTRAVCGSAKPTWTIYTSWGDTDMGWARSYCGV